MVTYHKSNGVQEHHIEKDQLPYKTKFLGTDSITIKGHGLSLLIKYGPDLRNPQLTVVNSLPMNIVSLLQD